MIYPNSTSGRKAFTAGGGIALGSEVAYSLRYVSPLFSGDVILARRGGDNVTEGFTPTEISDGTLTAWTSEGSGDGNGYVKTWYDQSGNANDATQTTNTSTAQPQIVTSNTLETTGGLPSIKWSGAAETLVLGTTIDHTSGFTNFQVEDFAGTNGFVMGTTNAIPMTATRFGNIAYIANGDYYWDDPSASITSGHVLVSGYCPPDAQFAGVTVRLNGTAQTMGGNNFTNTALQFAYLGRRGTQYCDSPGVQEFIFFAGDNTSEFSSIETEMNDYYSIFV